jgi:hypothetical protein
MAPRGPFDYPFNTNDDSPDTSNNLFDDPFPFSPSSFGIHDNPFDDPLPFPPQSPSLFSINLEGNGPPPPYEGDPLDRLYEILVERYGAGFSLTDLPGCHLLEAAVDAELLIVNDTSRQSHLTQLFTLSRLLYGRYGPGSAYAELVDRRPYPLNIPPGGATQAAAEVGITVMPEGRYEDGEGSEGSFDASEGRRARYIAGFQRAPTFFEKMMVFVKDIFLCGRE